MPRYYGTIDISDLLKHSIDVGPFGNAGVVVGNESGYTVIVAMEGTSTSQSLYPGTVDWFDIPPRGFTGIVTFQAQALLNNVSAWPGNFIQVDVFGANEARNSSAYPLALVRNTNVGNAVQTFAAVVTPFVTNLINDGNGAGLQVIEATVSGQSTSSVAITNDGIVTLGNSANHGFIKSDNSAFQSDGAGNLTTTAKCAVAGNLSVGSNFTTVRGTADFLNGANRNQVMSYVKFSFTTNGTSNQTIAHGFGATPGGFLITNRGSTPNTSGPGIVSFDATNVVFYSVGLTNTTYDVLAVG